MTSDDASDRIEAQMAVLAKKQIWFRALYDEAGSRWLIATVFADMAGMGRVAAEGPTLKEALENIAGKVKG